VLWLARGRPGPAARLLRRRLELLGDRPIELAAALGLLAEALVDEADLPGARAAADRLEALATDGRAARALALAHRARGRIAAAERDHDGAAAHLDRALACYAQLDLPLETARVRLDLARALARCEPEPAVAAAAGARASFVRLGAAADADAAAELLRSLGAPAPPGPREGGLLTRREEEVLALVARGLSNPEIAARLYISRKTVAHHVSSLLGKLGARTRAELIAHVAGTAGVAAPDRPG
jgi:DNA-binding NarL/FixJ family response regulator